MIGLHAITSRSNFESNMTRDKPDQTNLDSQLQQEFDIAKDCTGQLSKYLWEMFTKRGLTFKDFK